MLIVIGYLIAVAVSVAVLCVIAGRDFTVARDPDVNLAEVAGRHTGILSGLAGFAITGMVLLVTLGRQVSDPTSTSYTTVVTMFFISWMAYSGAAFLFANISDAKHVSGTGRGTDFDVAAGQFAGAGLILEFAFGLGWLALRPLFLAFGLQRLADLVAITSVAIAFISYGLVAHHLHRAGYGPGRVLFAIPALAFASTLVYGSTVGLLGLRSEGATLDLIVAGFFVGAVAFFALITLTIASEHATSARLLSRYGRYAVLAVAQGIVLLVGFLLLSILGLA